MNSLPVGWNITDALALALSTSSIRRNLSCPINVIGKTFRIWNE